jgi:hypothetical protein
MLLGLDAQLPEAASHRPIDNSNRKTADAALPLRRPPAPQAQRKAARAPPQRRPIAG